MKYFANINNAEELRKAYRQHVINMHPDRGGNEEEFKAMQAEFETLKKQYQNGTRREQYAHTETAEERARREAEEQREREEWARWEAEERARREQEEREKAERIRKAQEESRAAVRAWAAILERVAVDKTGEKARFYRFADKKEAAAFVAATKRNIQRVINHYFPGLKVKVTISGEIWKEKFIISWEDGPSEKQLRETCKELAFFIPASYCCAGPWEDYGHHEERHTTAPWREAYGQAMGDVDDFNTARTLSEEGKQQAEALAARILSGWNNPTGGQIRVTLTEFCNLREALGFERLNDSRMYWTNYASNDRREDGQDVADMYRDSLRRVIYENAPLSVSEEEKAARRAAKFAPRYGKALRTLQQLTGVGTTNDGDPVCFFCNTDSNSRRRLTIAEAVERLERGEAVSFGTEHTGADGDKWYWGKFAGGYKTQDKRAAKFAAAGLTIKGHTSPNAFVTLHGIAPEFAAAIREELADIEKQRREWEAKQNGTQTAQNEPTAAKTDNTPTDTQNADSASETAPADGLELAELAEGVAVTGNSRTTYKHRREIKAHGATWNKEAQQWQATDPDSVARLRAWFALREQDEPTATAQDEPTATAQNEPQANEPTATAQNEQSDKAAPFFDKQSGKAERYEAGEITDTTNEPTATAQDEPTAGQSADLSPLMEALADVLRIFGDIMQQAKQWEGVTIPAATLERWKQEANEGTKTAAARLCEVCACLACLTPDSRRDFDALGAIFWTLSEQLKQGYNPDNLQGATDYARAQLYDLIDRTQTRNQARAIREVLTPDNEHRTAA